MVLYGDLFQYMNNYSDRIFCICAFFFNGNIIQTSSLEVATLSTFQLCYGLVHPRFWLHCSDFFFYYLFSIVVIDMTSAMHE